MSKTPVRKHPTIFEPSMLVVGVGLALLGVIVGLELLTRVGITPNSSIIGAVVAIAIARIPLTWFRMFRHVGRQNLMQTVISGATFAGANAILLPLGVVWLLGRPDLAPAMMIGATLGLLIDATILYRMFDSSVYPATGLWPAGVATAECIIAGDQGGDRGKILGLGALAGGTGQLVGIPMDVFGVCWIGNIWALSMFAVGLLVRGYAPLVTGVDLDSAYVPHGVMVGAGMVALGQILIVVFKRHRTESTGDSPQPATTGLRTTIFGGYGAFVVAAAVLAWVSGVVTDMSVAMLIMFVLFAATAALVSELIVGISAMHAGWFPAFATALIFLVVGVLIGFPSVPLALLVGFTAATGPGFADMAYDFKAGWILRGRGTDPVYELAGRRQQFLAELLGFGVAIGFVALTYESYFTADLFPPVDRVYAATIEAGVEAGVAQSLFVWAVPGAILQLFGGQTRQLGVLFATGLLINNPVAGWTAAVALTVRVLLERRLGAASRERMYVLAGGFIAGSALTSFGTATVKAR